MDNVSNSSAPVYVNHGGIGFLADRGGSLGIPTAQRHEKLRLVAAFENRTLREIPAPVDGWDDTSLARALRSASHLILSFAPVDAWLGEQIIGCTEL